jgi:hypothetical protein
MRTQQAMGEEDVQAVKVGRAVRDMMQTEGWKYLHQILEHRLERERARLESPAALGGGGGDGIRVAMEREAICGGIIMLKFVMQTPQTMVETAESLLRQNREDGDE